MSRDKFDDNCAGCKPMMMDPVTRMVYPDDHPMMVVVLRLWSETTIEERRAWHRFTCQNSRAVEDLKFAQTFSERIDAALAPPGN